MGKKRYILFAILGLLLVALMTAALTTDGDSFKRLSASEAVKWMDSEGILPVSEYQTSSQMLDYDLLHVIYDNISLRFASTSFGPAVNMPAWPEELDSREWNDNITGADFITAMDRIPVNGTSDSVSTMRSDIAAASEVTVTRAAEYIYAVCRSTAVNYARISTLDDIDEFAGSMLDCQYYMCQFLFDGPNSTEMVINAVKAAMLQRNIPGISWSIRDMGAEGREFTVRFEY